MKKFVLTLLLATALVSLAGPSARAAVVSTGGASMSQDVGNGGILARLIELERRKNAALRRIFLGR
jgi:hypothetical protein